ncbi:MAG TPA: PDZ domain-containing protein [Frankiaceae bacterium]|nr:PDZ domain-containing protein [Frankiaceae bacterium]
MTRRTATLLVTSILVAALLAVGLALPVPYVADEPGPVSDTLAAPAGKPLIGVTGHPTYPTTGKLDLTTVSQDSSLTLWQALVGYLSKKKAVVPEEITKTPGQSDADLQRQYQQEMADSQKSAISAALHELRIPATVTVAGLADGSPAAGKLQKGDVLLAVDGAPAADAIDLRAKVGGSPPGKEISVRYKRGNAAPADARITTRPATDQDGAARSVIGVYLDEQRDVKVNLQMVSIDGQAVGGPSAGMMFALGIYDVMTPGSLTNGQTIAGTGTINPDGQVGPIGGIQQKLVGARQAGARVFLTPASNCAEARRAIPAGLRLVKVDTLDDAIGSLESIAAGRTDQPGC